MRAAVALLALALGVRLALVALTGDFDPVADPEDYRRHAASIAAGQGYPSSELPSGGPTAYRPPAYPALLGALFAVTGESFTAARLVQAMLGTVTVGLAGLVAFQLWGRRVALWALALGAVFPPMAALGATFLTEVLLTPLVLAAVVLLLHARTAVRPGRLLAAAGVVTGLAVLTRPNALLLVVPLALAAWTVRRAAWAPALAIACALLTIAPWTVRNALVMDAFVPLTTQDGYTLIGTYNEQARDHPTEPATWVPWYEVEGTAALAVRGRELGLGNRLRADALDYARDNPVYVLEVAYWNTRRLLHLTGLDFVRFDAGATALPQRLGIASAIAVWVLLPLAIAGAFTARARAAPGWLWLVPLSFLATVVIVAYARFRAPIDPFLVLLATLALAAASDRMHGVTLRRPLA